MFFSFQGSTPKETERARITSGIDKIELLIVLTWEILGKSQERKYVALFIHMTGVIKIKEYQIKAKLN